jgi:ubiquinone/menaquinone biosynthesis C-methylase UbiE
MFAMNARQYNERTMKGLFRKIYPVIAEQAVACTGIREGLCVDLGGGPGMLGICVAGASDMQVVIVDPLPECIELARENIAERGLDHRVSAQGGQAESLSFADGAVDLVVSRGSIYFWHDQRRGLREVFRVLRSGGWAYIGGGFGNKALRDEILAEKASDEQWNRQRSERGNKHPPGHFRALLAELGIDGEIIDDDSGMWIVFRKPAGRAS